MMRILKQQFASCVKDLVSQVLTFDYLGALAVSLLFPLLLVPHLGLIRTGVLFGLLNALVAAWALWLFREQLPQLRWLRGQCIAAIARAGYRLRRRRPAHHPGPRKPLLRRRHRLQPHFSPTSASCVTRWKGDLRLFLNGNLQFSSRDEYRYHEALVHPALARVPGARRVLVLGGGDGHGGARDPQVTTRRRSQSRWSTSTRR
ncbi:MAG: hypothetical protein MZV65_35285 [Chromatiales bacterium]|nr:hypothetical protein [Chromatiales bacterium]